MLGVPQLMRDPPTPCVHPLCLQKNRYLVVRQGGIGSNLIRYGTAIVKYRMDFLSRMSGFSATFTRKMNHSAKVNALWLQPLNNVEGVVTEFISYRMCSDQDVWGSVQIFRPASTVAEFDQRRHTESTTFFDVKLHNGYCAHRAGLQFKLQML